MSEALTYNPQKALWAGMASIITVVILIAIKIVMYFYSGSASVLASLMDSLLDVTVSVMTYFAISFSLKPADEDHRSGHGKIEGLAALFQAMLIALAGIGLLVTALERFFNPQPVTHHGLVIASMVVSIILSLVLVRIQTHMLKEAPSLAIEADRAHYTNDVIVNGGVIVVLLVLWLGGPLWVDPVFALMVAVYLGVTVKTIAGKGLDMLLDRELSDDVRSQIIYKVRAHHGVRDMHDLRTSQSGMRVFISFDIEVDGDMTLTAAHDISRQIEHDLLNDFPHAEIMIHIDPAGDPDDTRHNVR